MREKNSWYANISWGWADLQNSKNVHIHCKRSWRLWRSMLRDRVIPQTCKGWEVQPGSFLLRMNSRIMTVRGGALSGRWEFESWPCHLAHCHRDSLSFIALCYKVEIRTLPGDFPGGPVVKTPCFHCMGHRFDLPGRGTKILHAAGHGQKDKETNFYFKKEHFLCRLNNICP